MTVLWCSGFDWWACDRTNIDNFGQRKSSADCSNIETIWTVRLSCVGTKIRVRPRLLSWVWFGPVCAIEAAVWWKEIKSLKIQSITWNNTSPAPPVSALLPATSWQTCQTLWPVDSHDFNFKKTKKNSRGTWRDILTHYPALIYSYHSKSMFV